MKVSPLFFMLWTLGVMVLGFWMGVSAIHGAVSSGRVHVPKSVTLLDHATGDYMCLKIHQLGEGTKP